MLKGETMKVAGLRRVSWEDGQESAVRLWNQARETSEDLFYQINRHVRRHPWKAVAIALGVGAVLSLTLSKKGR
jgi:ElaB/YqjD/DUF883 family membrane-anchored ribosome-binding protein